MAGKLSFPDLGFGSDDMKYPGRQSEGARGRRGDAETRRRGEAPPFSFAASPRRPVPASLLSFAASPRRRVAASLVSSPSSFYHLSSRSPGVRYRPPPKPQSPSHSQGQRPVPPASDDTRPRRVGDEPQDEKPLKLKADLVTVITSVTDSSGNQINDLTQKDFDLFEDDAAQDIAGFYREGQIPLRLIFLFDTSSSIRHRFDFEQRAAAQFFKNVMRA